MVDLDYASDDTETTDLNERVDEGKTRSFLGGWMGTPAENPQDDELTQKEIDGDSA